MFLLLLLFCVVFTNLGDEVNYLDSSSGFPNILLFLVTTSANST